MKLLLNPLNLKSGKFLYAIINRLFPKYVLTNRYFNILAIIKFDKIKKADKGTETIIYLFNIITSVP
ncbi:hypothetical protein NRIC0776_02950 [Apilactobacillus kunkeei]